MTASRKLPWLLLCATLALAACETEKVEVLKSPCAGIDGSPCGPKRPVNGKLNHDAHSANTQNIS